MGKFNFSIMAAIGMLVIGLFGLSDQPFAGSDQISLTNSAEADVQPMTPANWEASSYVGVHPRKGSLGIGLARIKDWSAELPFIDLMKQSRTWKDWDNGIEGFDLDDNGWVRSLKPGQTAGTVFLVSKSQEHTVYDRVIVTYQGRGTIEYGGRAKKNDALSRYGRDVIDVGRSNHLLKITKTDPNDPIRNIKILIAEHEKLAKAGEIFNPDWLNKFSDLYAFRFMDWMNISWSNPGDWDNRPEVEHRTWATDGVPLETMIALANKTNIVPWFNMPDMADENYITEFAKLLRTTLNPHLPIYIEHSNELWNWGYGQAHRARDQAKEKWGLGRDGWMQWHGMRTATMCDIFKKKVFSDSTDRIKCVLGVQTAWHGLESSALDCPEWVKLGNEPCYTHGIDYLGLTSYFNGGLNGPRRDGDRNHKNQILAMASLGKKGIDQAFDQLEAGNILRGVEKFKDYKGVVHELQQQLEYWRKTSQKYNMGLVAYEGGQHISANALALQENETVTNFHIAINRDPRMQKIYQDVLRSWKKEGGELHVLFDDVRGPSKWGAWGALESLNQLSSPKYDAIMGFNTTVACWWKDCTIANRHIRPL